jgi:hypothetical protein
LRWADIESSKCLITQLGNRKHILPDVMRYEYVRAEW